MWAVALGYTSQLVAICQNFHSTVLVPSLIFMSVHPLIKRGSTQISKAIIFEQLRCKV